MAEQARDERRDSAMATELPLISPSWVPEACTLPTAEQPLRVASFDQFFASAVQDVTRPEPGRVRLNLRPGHEIAARAAELAAAETECCSFFIFTLTVAGGGLTLDVSAGPAHAAVLDALARRAAAAAGRDS